MIKTNYNMAAISSSEELNDTEETDNTTATDDTETTDSTTATDDTEATDNGSILSTETISSENVSTEEGLTGTPEPVALVEQQSSPSPVLYVGVGLIAGVLLGIGLHMLIQKGKGNRNGNSAPVMNYVPEPIQPIEQTVEEQPATRASGTAMETPTGGTVGKLHNIGRRNGQQDSLGLTEFNGGTLAVVADGMGGLADGDKVSQKIVMTMLQDSTALSTGNTENKLYEMVAHATREVNQMLGPDKLYKCGSTLTSVLVEPGYFQWISVGDSHIYLYRGSQLLLLNREHIYEAELLQQAVNGEISFGEVKKHPKRKGLTSFIGMGELKHIDGSSSRIPSQKGDWLLLMSDGVFNTVPEADICRILSQAGNAEAAARQLEDEVLRRQNPKQDNFTAIILEL